MGFFAPCAHGTTQRPDRDISLAWAAMRTLGCTAGRIDRDRADRECSVLKVTIDETQLALDLVIAHPK